MTREKIFDVVFEWPCLESWMRIFTILALECARICGRLKTVLVFPPSFVRTRSRAPEDLWREQSNSKLFQEPFSSARVFALMFGCHFGYLKNFFQIVNLTLWLVWNVCRWNPSKWVNQIQVLPWDGLVRLFVIIDAWKRPDERSERLFSFFPGQ